jgi:hypothetical protein
VRGAAALVAEPAQGVLLLGDVVNGASAALVRRCMSALVGMLALRIAPYLALRDGFDCPFVCTRSFKLFRMHVGH